MGLAGTEAIGVATAACAVMGAGVAQHTPMQVKMEYVKVRMSRKNTKIREASSREGSLVRISPQLSAAFRSNK